MDKMYLLLQGFYDIAVNPDGSFNATKDGVRFHKLKEAQRHKNSKQKYIIKYADVL